MKSVFVSACFILVTASLFAQEPAASKPVADTRDLADRAMAFVKQEKFAEAYALVKPFWPLPAVEIDGLANQTNTQWPMIRQRYGKSLSTEFISEKKVGQSFVKYTYLQKFERHAMRWTFVFYKPKDYWLVNGVAWGDVDQLLE